MSVSLIWTIFEAHPSVCMVQHKASSIHQAHAQSQNNIRIMQKDLLHLFQPSYKG